ncbi:hypothetical protein [Phyllobacterium sp. YR531]|uniref:hypothetical protein n=1 Tax=Phyllobacterium sp. YR531 TaxID=1144343 RepID=UPI00026F7606|nr:hypothetical protein [Phyllobacterium sp. YR531]EJM98894.1 hypothetical protein PMI41_04657 [Phyllobacterium sp. YR531]
MKPIVGKAFVGVVLKNRNPSPYSVLNPAKWPRPSTSRHQVNSLLAVMGDIMRFSGKAGILLLLAGVYACTTTTTGGSKDQVTADAKALVITSYQCQASLGREPHYSAIESSETVLKAIGKSPEDADRTVRGWLKGVIASPKQPTDLDSKTCKDKLLTLAEKVRIGYESLNRLKK